MIAWHLAGYRQYGKEHNMGVALKHSRREIKFVTHHYTSYHRNKQTV